MISAKTYTVQEFNEAVPGFAQALINKIAERKQDTKVKIIQESPREYLIVIENGEKNTHAYKEECYSLVLAADGLIESTSVYRV